MDSAPLVLVQISPWWAADPLAFHPGITHPGLDALNDQAVFELGHCFQDGEYHFPGRGTGVELL